MTLSRRLIPSKPAASESLLLPASPSQPFLILDALNPHPHCLIERCYRNFSAGGPARLLLVSTRGARLRGQISWRLPEFPGEGPLCASRYSRCVWCVSSGNAGLRPGARGVGVEFSFWDCCFHSAGFLVGEVSVCAGVRDAAPSRPGPQLPGVGGLEWSGLPEPIQLSLQFVPGRRWQCVARSPGRASPDVRGPTGGGG